MTRIHTIVFDLDDTLFAEAEFVFSGFRAVDEWLGRTAGVAGFSKAAGELFNEGHRGRIFDQALGRLGLPVARDVIEKMISVYREHRPQVSLLPDARAALGRLEGRYKFGLVSDGFHDVQKGKFAALQIAQKFDCVVFTDALGREHWKPSPAGFLRVMESLSGEPGGYVYVGDNPRKDFLAPRQLGWRSVRIRRLGGEHASYDAASAEAADVEIGSLEALPPVIDSMR